MRESLNKIVAVLRYLELPIKKPSEDFNSRFLIQKIAFLSKTLGISLYHKFSLYVKGPYSSVLAQDCYQFSNEIVNYQTDYELNENDIEIVDKLKDIVISHPIMSEYPFEFLEAVSTIVLLKMREPELDDSEVFAKIKSIKNFLKESIIIIANNIAKKLLFKAEFLTEEIKRELEIWDRVD